MRGEYTSWLYKLYSTLGVLLHVVFVDAPSDFWRWMSKTEKSVCDRVVVITGAGSGLGRRMAYLFAVERKATVALLDVNEAALTEAVEEIREAGGRASHWTVDITDHVRLDAVAAEIEGDLGPVDIIICNAAVLFFGLFLDVTPDQMRKALDVNVLGTTNTIRSFLPSFIARERGQVVAVSSIAGYAGETYGIAYCPTKFAVRGVMECVEMEMRDRGLHGIHCTTLCPYFARTPMILNVGMRPTSTWLPFMSINSCARQMVKAVLEEQVVAFVPSFTGAVALFKNLASRDVLRSLREYLQCRYEPTGAAAPSPSGSFILAPMADYFRRVHLVWWAIIPPALLINLLAYLAPEMLRLIPGIGGPIADFAKAYPTVVYGTNLFAAVAHAGEGLVALAVSVKTGNSFATSFRWFVQTFIMGYPSLSMILAHSAKKSGAAKKGKKN